jgi:hypothetical protein
MVEGVDNGENEQVKYMWSTCCVHIVYILYTCGVRCVHIVYILYTYHVTECTNKTHHVQIKHIMYK